MTKVIAHGNMVEGGTVFNRIREIYGEDSIKVIYKNIYLPGFFEWTSREDITYLVKGDSKLKVEIHEYSKEALKHITYAKFGFGNDIQLVILLTYTCKAFYLPTGVYTLLEHKERTQ